MIVRISQQHPFRLAFDTTVVEGGGSGSDIADVAEAVAEAVADAVEDAVDAVADAVEDTSGGSASLDHERRITQLEMAVEAMGLVIAELQGAAQAAASTAGAALEVAQDATTPDEVEAMIEETHIEDTNNDGSADIVDAPDEPPAETKKSLLFATPREVRERFFRKDND